MTLLCRWLNAVIALGPADHPRGQGAVERLGGWLQELLAEICRSWPQRWDEHVSPAIWIKRTLPGVSVPSNMTLFELMFGRKPRTSLDSLMPLSEETRESGGLDNFVEPRKQNLHEVRLALGMRGNQRAAARAHANAIISRPSAGVTVERGSLSCWCANQRAADIATTEGGSFSTTTTQPVESDGGIADRPTCTSNNAGQKTTHPKCIHCRREAVPPPTSDPETRISQRVCTVCLGPAFQVDIGSGSDFVV